MTFLEYAQHVLPATRIEDLEEGTSPARIQELCLCLTQAISEYFSLAPSNYRKTTVTRSVSAPQTLTAVSLTNGTPVVGGAPFDPSWRGRSIRFADGTWNEIVSPSRMLHQWDGTTGTQDATVYPDAIAIDDMLVQKVCTHPQYIDLLGGFAPLTMRAPGTVPALPFDPVPYAVGLGYGRRRDFASRPNEYWVEHVGQSIQVDYDAVFQFRVYPIPVIAWRCQFEAEILPLPIRIQDLSAATTIPVPDSLAHQILIPLARGRASDSPIIRLVDKDDRAALKAAELVARAAIGDLPPTFAASETLLGTPENW